MEGGCPLSATMCAPKVDRQHAHESLQMLQQHDALLKLPVADVVGNNTVGIFDPKCWKDLRFDTSPKKIPAKRLKKESPTETDNISWSGVSKSAALNILTGKGATAEQLGIEKNTMVDFRVDHTAHKKAFANMFHLSEEQMAKQQQNTVTTPTMSNTQQHSREPLMDKQNDTHKLHKHAASSDATSVETSKQANAYLQQTHT